MSRCTGWKATAPSLSRSKAPSVVSLDVRPQHEHDYNREAELRAGMNNMGRLAQFLGRELRGRRDAAA